MDSRPAYKQLRSGSVVVVAVSFMMLGLSMWPPPTRASLVRLAGVVTKTEATTHKRVRTDRVFLDTLRDGSSLRISRSDPTGKLIGKIRPGMQLSALAERDTLRREMWLIWELQVQGSTPLPHELFVRSHAAHQQRVFNMGLVGVLLGAVLAVVAKVLKSRSAR